LSVTANDGSKVYGQTKSFSGTEFSSSGLQNGETIGLVTLGSTGASATAHVGSDPITVSGASGGTFTASDYTITYNSGTLTVTPAGLSVTADNQSRVYGAANPGLTYNAVGLVNGDTLSGALATSAGATSVAGTYSITQGSLSASTDYLLTFNPGVLTITGTSSALSSRVDLNLPLSEVLKSLGDVLSANGSFSDKSVFANIAMRFEIEMNSSSRFGSDNSYPNSERLIRFIY
jgi:hypothetical protein